MRDVSPLHRSLSHFEVCYDTAASVEKAAAESRFLQASRATSAEDHLECGLQLQSLGCVNVGRNGSWLRERTSELELDNCQELKPHGGDHNLSSYASVEIQLDLLSGRRTR